MTPTTQGVLAILAALLVILSTTWQPPVLTVITAAGLFLFGIYRLVRARRS